MNRRQSNALTELSNCMLNKSICKQCYIVRRNSDPGTAFDKAWQSGQWYCNSKREWISTTEVPNECLYILEHLMSENHVE
jgi:hypothetical protein